MLVLEELHCAMLQSIKFFTEAVFGSFMRCSEASLNFNAISGRMGNAL